MEYDKNFSEKSRFFQIFLIYALGCDILLLERNFGDENVKSKNTNVTEVVAALIWRGEQFMICQRPAHKARGLLWEFVGGKVEKGEAYTEALIRECREELDVTVKPLDTFMDVTHVYPDMTVHLILINAVISEGEPKMLEHNDIRWITPDEIPKYDFCPADVEILKEIQRIK